MEGVVMRSSDHVRLPSGEFWNGKRVLLTGHTGFKGAWLSIWLKRMGASVTGISLAPHTVPSLFELADIDAMADSHECDIRDGEKLQSLVRAAQPQVVFHLAAQAIVRVGYRNPVESFETNASGTAQVLEAMRMLEGVKVGIMVTTDKVYRNHEWAYPYREDDALGGHDPYSASKAAAEMVIESYRKAFFAQKEIAIASARAGNVIGGGDWAEDRLIPDAVRAWEKRGELNIRRPDATRPWQHVLEPLAGYILLAEHLWEKPADAGAFNFGPYTHEAANVREVVNLARDAYGHGEVVWGDGTEGPHEAGWLALEIAKSRQVLDYQPRWSLKQAITRSMRWYADLANGAKAIDLCHADIDAYESVNDE